MPSGQDVLKVSGRFQIVEFKARKAGADAERTAVRDRGFRPKRNTEISDFENVLAEWAFA
jgi:hypothetical protein